MKCETSRYGFGTIAVELFSQCLMYYFQRGLLPSLAIGVTAFCAGEMLLDNKKEKPLSETDKSLYEILENAKAQNKEIISMVPKIEDSVIKSDLAEMYETVNKIIDTVKNKPNKKKKLGNFFDYYLPVTVKLLKKYDEIENQRLSSEDGKVFMEQAKSKIGMIKEAFKKQLSILYQSDLVDAEAEMKVLDSMLKADGFDSSDFDLGK